MLIGEILPQTSQQKKVSLTLPNNATNSYLKMWKIGTVLALTTVAAFLGCLPKGSAKGK
jgi:hypothetical protein